MSGSNREESATSGGIAGNTLSREDITCIGAQRREALAVQMAGMKCQRCTGEGIIPASISDLDPAFTCPDCHGTSFLFGSSVRVSCPCLAKGADGRYLCDRCSVGHSADCDCCGGRRWTPSLDFVTVREAIVQVGYRVEEVHSLTFQCMDVIAPRERHALLHPLAPAVKRWLMALAQKEQTDV